MTRTVIGIVVLAMGLVPASRVRAGCNAFPQASSASLNANDVAMTFNGTRGTLASPFLLATQPLRITRRTCEKPDSTTFPASVDDIRTLVVVHPSKGKNRIVVLKHDNSVNDACPNSSDDFTKNCDKAVKDAGFDAHVDCFTVTDYSATQTTLDITVPDTTSGAHAISSRAAVVVLKKDDDAKVCGVLAQPGKYCGDAIKAQAGLLTCIDQIGDLVDPQNDPCGKLNLHAVFPEVTLLPEPNDAMEICTDASGGQLSCNTTPADGLRYGVDQPGNLLVPISWTSVLDQCKGDTLVVDGQLRPPSPLPIPDNRPNLASNKWLESYTFDGKPNVPPFTKGTPDNSQLDHFLGTTDEDESVLRFGTNYGACSSSTGSETCNHVDLPNTTAPLQCSTAGDKCLPLCASDGTACPNQLCPGTCGKLFDYSQQAINGGWKLNHPGGGKGFCASDPPKLCPQKACASNADCVSYVVNVTGCEVPDNDTPPGPSFQQMFANQQQKNLSQQMNDIQAKLAPEFQNLGGVLGLVQDAALKTTAFSADAIALIAPVGLLVSEQAAKCRKLGMDFVLVAASRNTCTGPDNCPFTCPQLGTGDLDNRLAVFGTKVRLLQFPEAITPATGWFDRFTRFLAHPLGGSAATPVKASGASQEAFLKILDAVGGAVRTVGKVVIDNPHFDPFAVGPSGGTKLLAKVGRCVRTDTGKKLGIPSFCKADTDCPSWAKCAPADVVMAMDLSRIL